MMRIVSVSVSVSVSVGVRVSVSVSKTQKQVYQTGVWTGLQALKNILVQDKTGLKTHYVLPRTIEPNSPAFVLLFAASHPMRVTYAGVLVHKPYGHTYYDCVFIGLDGEALVTSTPNLFGDMCDLQLMMRSWVAGE